MESRVIEQKVHFFEHYSLEKFEEYFRGAFHYAANIAIDKMLGFVHLRYYKDEILLILESAIQSFFLFRHDATYAEFFYNFKRFPTGSGDPISKKSKLLVVLLSSLTPYIRSKLQRKFTDIQAKNANFQLLTPSEKRFQAIFPSFIMCFRLVNFFLNSKYLLNPTFEYYSLEYLLVKQTLSRVNPDQAAEIQNGGMMSQLADFAKKYFIFGLFLTFQGLDWFYRRGSGSGRSQLANSGQSQAMVLPPSQSQEGGGSHQNISSAYCSLCKSLFKNPAALSSSGNVFCFSCISEYVKNYKKCPISQTPSEEKMIIKLYVNA